MDEIQEKENKWQYGELENKILNVAVTDRSFFLTVKDYVKYTFFIDELNGKILKILKMFYKTYNFIPTKDILINFAKKVFPDKVSLINERIDFIYNRDNVAASEKDYILREIDNFIKQNKLKSAILQSVGLLEKENYDLILKNIQEAIKFSTKVDKCFQLTEKIEDRYLKFTNPDNIVPFFINTLNSYTGGGAHRGELSIFMAASGFGKSTALLNQAVFSLKNNLSVLYVTLELSEYQVAFRMDKCLWNKGTEEIKSDWRSLKKSYENFKKANMGKLFIYSASAYTFKKSDLERLLEQLKTNENFAPDILIIDYLELMQSSVYNSRMGEYERQGIISADLRNLAVELNVSVVTATQTNRKVFDLDKDDENVSEQQVVGESINKVKLSDGFFLILQSKQESTQDFGRLRIVKNRHGRTQVDINLILSFDKMRIEEKLIV